MNKHTIDTKIRIDYKTNEGLIEKNYEDKNMTDYDDLEKFNLVDIDLKDVNIKLICNNTSLFFIQSLFHLAEHLISKYIASIV